MVENSSQNGTRKHTVTHQTRTRGTVLLSESENYGLMCLIDVSQPRAIFFHTPVVYNKLLEKFLMRADDLVLPQRWDSRSSEMAKKDSRMLTILGSCAYCSRAPSGWTGFCYARLSAA